MTVSRLIPQRTRSRSTAWRNFSAAAAAMLLVIPSLGVAQNQVVGAGFGSGYYSPVFVTVTAGEVLTLFTPALNVPDEVADGTPLPTSLSGVSVSVRVAGAKNSAGYPTSLPILRVFTEKLSQLPDGTPCPTEPNSPMCSRTGITVQIPTEGVCEPTGAGHPPPENCTAPPFRNMPNALLLNVRANGITGPDFPVQLPDGGPGPV